MPKSLADFRYDDATYDSLWNSLSAARMATYLREAGHDRNYAVRLYKWNARLAGAILFPLHIAEVALRNALVSGSDGALHVVGPETIYAWMSACAATCGLADLTGTPASELISNNLHLRHRFCDAGVGEPEARHLFEQGRANGAPFDVLLLKERNRDGVEGEVVGIVDEASIA